MIGVAQPCHQPVQLAPHFHHAQQDRHDEDQGDGGGEKQRRDIAARALAAAQSWKR